MSAPVTPPRFGEQGRRRSAVQWGVKYPALPGEFAAGVDPCVDRDHAEAVARTARIYGRDLTVVSRTVTTYTTAWTKLRDDA